VNLIPYNPVAGLPFGRPDPEAVDRFVGILRDRGISVTVRKTKGQAIDAACGQLRRRLDGSVATDPDRGGPEATDAGRSAMPGLGPDREPGGRRRLGSMA
jgi:23S rRNA (adenine2503-C2)-methyltransferase